MGCGFRQHVPIAVEHIAKAQAVAIGPASRTHDMAREVNGSLAVGQDRFNTNPVSILDLKIVDCTPGRRCVLRVLIGQSYCHTLMVPINPLDPDVTERSCGSNSAGVLDNRGERRFPCLELIDRRTLDRTEYSDLGTGGRHKQRIPALKRRGAAPDTIKKKIEEGELGNKLLAR